MTRGLKRGVVHFLGWGGGSLPTLFMAEERVIWAAATIQILILAQEIHDFRTGRNPWNKGIIDLVTKSAGLWLATWGVRLWE